MTAFRARRSERAGRDDDAEVGEEAAERPASMAGTRLRVVAEDLRGALTDHRAREEELVEAALEALTDATDPTAVEAELAAVRAETQRLVGEAESRAADDQRERARRSRAAQCPTRECPRHLIAAALMVVARQWLLIDRKRRLEVTGGR